MSPGKRIFDIALSALGLFIFFPLGVFIIFLIFIEDGRPIFYVKKYIGNNGDILSLLKFRSLDREGVYCTRTGRLLRTTAMDELPQLINIFKGDMSFVGPRPYGIEHYGFPRDFQGKHIDISSVSPDNTDFFQRLKLVPGLAGLAQLYLPKYAGKEEVLRLDLKYAQKQNFLLDISIISISIFVSLMGKWENRTKKL